MCDGTRNIPRVAEEMEKNWMSSKCIYFEIKLPCIFIRQKRISEPGFIFFMFPRVTDNIVDLIISLPSRKMLIIHDCYRGVSTAHSPESKRGNKPLLRTDGICSGFPRHAAILSERISSNHKEHKSNPRNSLNIDLRCVAFRLSCFV